MSKFVEIIVCMAKAFEQEMHKYFVQLNDAEQQSVLQMLKTFLQGRRINNPGQINLEQYNREIEEAVARVESGDYLSHEEVEKMAKGW